MRASVALILLLVACKPPPVQLLADSADPGPAIEIVFPQSNDEIPLNADCLFEVMVAVDIDNLVLVEPDADVEGEGHWHLQITVPTGFGYAPVSTTLGSLLEEGLSPGEPVEISASLQSNTHQALDAPPSTVEVIVAEPTATGITCP